MATAKFNEVTHSIFNGLLRDALTDQAYDQPRQLYEMYMAVVNEKPEEHFQMIFIEMIRNREDFRACIKSKDTTKLESILLQKLSKEHAGLARELFLSLQNAELFRPDVTKKAWKRIQKLVYACNLQKIVTGGDDEEEGPVPKKKSKEEARSQETSQMVRARIERFNIGYHGFLTQLSAAFPESDGSPSQECLEAFETAVAGDSEIVLNSFKKHVMPCIPSIAEAVQNKGDPNAQAKAFEKYFGRDSRWFKQLPFVDRLPIDKYWEHQMCTEQYDAFIAYYNLNEAEQAEFWIKRWVDRMAPEVQVRFTSMAPDAREELRRRNPVDKKDEALKAEWERVYSNKMVIMKALADLTSCMSGLDTLIYSPIVAILKDRAVDVMKREKITPDSLVPGSENFNRASAMNLVMSLIDAIPEATKGKISKEDIQTLITNTMAGRDEVPASFHEVFSPDMLDMDCLDVVADLPGIGDALGPVFASMQGQLKGHTGAPAFASVEHPAWLERDGPQK